MMLKEMLLHVRKSLARTQTLARGSPGIWEPRESFFRAA
jgi:hypothetical protein